MPIHDWTRVPSGLFHHFRQDWSVELAIALNDSVLGKDYFALLERCADNSPRNAFAFEINQAASESSQTSVLTRRKSSISDACWYAAKANRIAIRQRLGDLVAIVEIVSPGNKDSKNAIASFVRKAIQFLRNGIHLLVIDLFPPSCRNLQGIHQVIWDEFEDGCFELPSGKLLTLASYEAVPEVSAFIEPVAVGMSLPEMPLFLAPGEHVLVPLENTYQATWQELPRPIRDMLS